MIVLGIWKTYFESICRIECQQENLFCIIGEADAGFSSLSRSNQNDIVLFYTLLLSSDCHFSDFPLLADLEFQIQILQ